MGPVKLPEINRIQMTGRLTDAPELSFTSNGVGRTLMRLASNRTVRNTENDRDQETTYITAVAWKKIAEVCAEYLEKGSAVYVEGKLRSRRWQMKDGNSRMLYEIHVEHLQFLDRRPDTE